MNSEDTVLELTNVSKVMKGKGLVENITFSVNKGEVFGFLGPNGAGKTTTIRMIVGLIKPTTGAIRISGYDVQKQFTKAMENVGCIVESPELYSYLTGWENLMQFRRMQPHITLEKVEEMVALVGLTNRIHERVKTYSLGMKQRLGIAQALLGEPQLLILDEPTNGLDPQGIRELREFVRMLVTKRNISVFISSHLLSEIQLMCDRVAVIHHGHILTVDTIERFMDATKGEWVIKTSMREQCYQFLQTLSFVTSVRMDEDDDESIVCIVKGDDSEQLLNQCVQHNLPIRSLQPKPVVLEDVFLQWTNGGVEK